MHPEPASEAPETTADRSPRPSDGRRFFTVNDGGATYFLVARTVDHARQLLRDSGVEFTDDDLCSASVDDPRFAHLVWTELTADRAAEIVTHGEDGTRPLSERELGDWFCTEW